MILYTFLFSIAAIIIGCILLPTPDLLAGTNSYIGQAYTYTVGCALAFVFGYFVLPKGRKASTSRNLGASLHNEEAVPRSVLLVLIFLSAIGVTILLIEINSSIGLRQYFSIISSDNSADTIRTLGYATLGLDSSQGGMPGIIKMFGVNYVLAPFCLLALLARGYRIRGAVNIGLTGLIGLLFLAGSALKVNRLLFLALVPVFLSLVFNSRSKAGKAIAVSGVLLLIVALVVQSARRDSEMGFLIWAGLYLHLGIINLGLMIKTNTTFTFGLTAVFSTITFIFKSIGVNVLPESLTYDWVWTPAQNAFGYMFEDFGWFGIIFFLLSGMAGRLVDIKAAVNRSGGGKNSWQEIQWLLAYACLSLPFVPAYDSVEFPLLIIMSVLIIRFTIASIRRKRDLTQLQAGASPA